MISPTTCSGSASRSLKVAFFLVGRSAMTGKRASAWGPAQPGLLLTEHEAAEVGAGERVGLVAVAHDPQAHEVRHRGGGVAVLEVLAELGVEIDLLAGPGVERRAGLEHHRLLHPEQVGLVIAGGALGPHRAPDVLDGVPAQPPLPGDVE